MKKIAPYLREVLVLLGEKKNKLPALLVLFLASSFLDLAGIGLIAPYVSLIIDQNSFLQSEVYSYFTIAGFPEDPNDLIIFLGLILVGVFFLKALIAIIVNKSILNFSFQFGVDLRSFLMRSYQGIPYAEYIQRNSSEYIYSIHGLVTQFSQGVLQAILRLFSEGIVVLVILVILFMENGLALLLLISLILGSALIYDWLFKHKIKEYGRSVNESSELMMQGIQEGMEGLKEIRILSKERYFYKLVKKGAQCYADAQVRSAIISTMPRYLLEFILILFIVLLVAGSIVFTGNVSNLIPTLSMFAVASLRLIPSSTQIITSITKLRFYRNSVSILYKDILSLRHRHIAEGSMNMQKKCKIYFQTIELKNVQFSYPDTNKPAINNISLKIKSGDSIGLVGLSGSGKSTLVDILLGLLEVDKGGIFYNNKPLSECLLQWQAQVAYLPQEIFLMDNTLKNNIALGVEDDCIDLDRLNLAIKKAKIKELVSQLPHGVNTSVGEGGVRLSGGQRQRVALARAFYYNKSVLVMDESTSALDYETEREIVNEIKQLKGRVTLIVIAHRLSTIEHCDRVYRLDDGRIIENNNFKE